MSDLATEPLPPLKPRERHQTIQTDTFCTHCGYNLMSQPVSRDERLGIFVARCPECGRFHPAGVGVSAANVWMQRLASFLLLFWVLIVLFAAFWIVMGMGVISVSHTEIFAYGEWVDQTGRPVERSMQVVSPSGVPTWVWKGTTQPATPYQVVMTLTPTSPDDYPRWDPWVFAAILGFAAVVGLVPGILLVVVLWHWGRRRYLWALLVPVAVAVVMAIYYRFDPEYERVVGWATKVTFGYALIQMLFLLIGIQIGRPIARTALRLIVPPKPRQHLAFLWHADGKTL